MKKAVILSVLGLISLSVVVLSIIMISTVSGDNLLYTNVEFGYFCANGYRFAIIALIVVTVFWVVFGIKQAVSLAKKYTEKRKKTPSLTSTTPIPIAMTGQNEAILIPAPAENKPRFCQFCGTQLEFDSEFCQNCGNKIPEQNSAE